MNTSTIESDPISADIARSAASLSPNMCIHPRSASSWIASFPESTPCWMRSRSLTLGAAAANHDSDSSIESSREPSRKNRNTEPSTSAAQNSVAVCVFQPPSEKLRLIWVC